jgi:hypothetical protein
MDVLRDDALRSSAVELLSACDEPDLALAE